MQKNGGGGKPQLYDEKTGKYVKYLDKSTEELRENAIIELCDKEYIQQDIDDIFGNEYKGYKGQQAIDKLLKEKQGHIKKAFYHNNIGYIDLVWGNEKAGICHIINKRNKLLANKIGHISGLDMVKKIPDIISKGVFSIDKYSRIKIEYDGFRVGISSKYFDKKVNWIVTAMEILK